MSRVAGLVKKPTFNDIVEELDDDKKLSLPFRMQHLRDSNEFTQMDGLGLQELERMQENHLRAQEHDAMMQRIARSHGVNHQQLMNIFHHYAREPVQAGVDVGFDERLQQELMGAQYLLSMQNEAASANIRNVSAGLGDNLAAQRPQIDFSGLAAAADSPEELALNLAAGLREPQRFSLATPREDPYDGNPIPPPRSMTEISDVVRADERVQREADRTWSRVGALQLVPDVVRRGATRAAQRESSAAPLRLTQDLYRNALANTRASLADSSAGVSPAPKAKPKAKPRAKAKAASSSAAPNLGLPSPRMVDLLVREMPSGGAQLPAQQTAIEGGLVPYQPPRRPRSRSRGVIKQPKNDPRGKQSKAMDVDEPAPMAVEQSVGRYGPMVPARAVRAGFGPSVVLRP